MSTKAALQRWVSVGLLSGALAVSSLSGGFAASAAAPSNNEVGSVRDIATNDAADSHVLGKLQPVPGFSIVQSPYGTVTAPFTVAPVANPLQPTLVIPTGGFSFNKIDRASDGPAPSR